MILPIISAESVDGPNVAIILVLRVIANRSKRGEGCECNGELERLSDLFQSEVG